jgi:hypothetical protein
VIQISGDRWVGVLLVAAALCSSCGNVVPSSSAAPSGGSGDPVPSMSDPAETTGATPVPPVFSQPPTTASASPAATPPYTTSTMPEAASQEPGTIIFGSLPGPLEERRLEPFVTWPEGGLTYEAAIAFGAFWGEPLRAPQIRITLYRVSGETLQLVWTDTKEVGPDATGYLDKLVPFTAPGTYRLEVTRGSRLLAWGIAFMGPRCEANCSGG